MKKKGFTLIELLAVIVVLAIIALIAVPMVLNAIENAKVGSNKNSVYGIIEAAELYTANQLINNSFETDTNILGELSYKGNQPDNYSYYGYGVYVNEEGKIGVAVIYDEKCYLKNYNDTEVRVEDYSDLNCNLSNLEVWNGESEEVVAVEDTYYVYNAKQLSWIQEQSVNGNTFEGKTIVLKNDIDLGGIFDSEGNTLEGSKEFAPIGNNTYKFAGTFDGEGHTIYNLYIKQSGNFAGLFGDSQDAIIKNITVQNSYIEGNNCVGIIGSVRSNTISEILNVKSINNIMIANGYLGGIIGQVATNANTQGIITITDCYSSSRVLGNSYTVGGIVGALANNGTSVTVDNNLNEGYVQGETKWIGGIIGITSQKGSEFIVVSNNMNKGTVTTSKGAFRVGGIIGNANYGVLLYNNINYGNIDGYGDGTSTSYGAGGIVGSVSYEEDESIQGQSKLISNANYGNVKSNLSAGGIAGNLYQETTSGDNILYSYNEGSVEAISGYAGGIIGKSGDSDQLIDTEYVSHFVNNALNKGDVKGLHAAGLIGANIGIKNSITLGNLTGTNNYGVIGHTLDGVIIENAYYPNIYTSSYGTSFDKNTFTKENIKNILGDVYWNYEGEVPRLYKVNVTVNDNNISSIDVTNELLN